MENPDVSHDTSKKNEAIGEIQLNSLCDETLLHNQNETEAFLKNLNDLTSNNSHLKRKRESELTISVKDKNFTSKF